MLAGNAHRIADGEEPLEPSEPRGRATFSQPMVLRADPPVPLDGDAAALDAPAGHDRRARARAEHVRGAQRARPRSSTRSGSCSSTARELWRGLPESETRTTASRRRARRSGSIHLADILAVTADAPERSTAARTTLEPPVGRTLAETLREDLGLTGTKIACGEGHCGACTVLVDGVPTLSCITLVHTVERPRGDDDRGPARPSAGRRVRAHRRAPVRLLHAGPDRLRVALVAANPSPSSDEIRHAMAGNLCRCGTYPRIEEAIPTWRG